MQLWNKFASDFDSLATRSSQHLTSPVGCVTDDDVTNQMMTSKGRRLMLTLALTTAPALLLLLARAEIRGETRLQRVLSISTCVLRLIGFTVTLSHYAQNSKQNLIDFVTEIKIST